MPSERFAHHAMDVFGSFFVFLFLKLVLRMGLSLLREATGASGTAGIVARVDR